MAEQIICSTISNAHREPLCSHGECAERLKALHSKFVCGGVDWSRAILPSVDLYWQLWLHVSLRAVQFHPMVTGSGPFW